MLLTKVGKLLGSAIGSAYVNETIQFKIQIIVLFSMVKVRLQYDIR